MYAIIKTGGKQYTVKPGDVLRVEKLDADLGTEIKLTDVLMVGGDKTYIGEKAGSATVTAVVTNQERGPKIIFFKKKRRHGYRRMGGHRQPYTELFVKSISCDGQVDTAQSKPVVYDPEKKAEKMAKSEEIRLARKEQERKAKASGELTETAPKTPAKKAAAKKTATKGAKRKSGGAKKAGAKKTAKKTTKK